MINTRVVVNVVAEVGAIVDGKRGGGMKVMAVRGDRIVEVEVEVEVGKIIRGSIRRKKSIDAYLIIITNIMTIVKDHQPRRDRLSL